MAHMDVIRSGKLEECIQNCRDTHEVTLQTLSYCMQRGGRHASLDSLKLLMDCAEITQSCANFMLRGSDVYVVVCGACAEVCEESARAVSALSDDFQMKICAEIMRRCADSCHQMRSPRVAA
jgi:hypothetical protein